MRGLDLTSNLLTLSQQTFCPSMAGLLLTHPANTDDTSCLLWKWSSGSAFSVNKKDFPSAQVSVGVLSVEMENGNMFLDGGDSFSVVNHVSKTPRQASE